MEYHVECGHTIGRIQHIYIMSIIYLFYTTCRLATQTVAPNIPGFHGIKSSVQYLYSHPHKPIFYSSNYYDGSKKFKLILSEKQVEYHTTQNVLECDQCVDHDIVLNRRRSVLGIIYTLLGVPV